MGDRLRGGRVRSQQACSNTSAVSLETDSQKKTESESYGYRRGRHENESEGREEQKQSRDFQGGKVGQKSIRIPSSSLRALVF